MSILDRIKACNQFDLGKFRPFIVDGKLLGHVRTDLIPALAEESTCFDVWEDGVTLAMGLKSAADRQAALDDAFANLHARHGFPKLRGERFAVAPRFKDAPMFSVDRGVVSVLGIRAYGVHVNGFVQDAPLRLWVGTRSMTKPNHPGKLDNMVAGGQPAGLGLLDNVVKEAHEEAGVPEDMARNARPVGAVTYCLEDDWGLKPDSMFVFDLMVPPDFKPVNQDGEVEKFTLMPANAVRDLISETEDVKFNVNLVMADFLIRKGIITPENEPDYLEIVRGLRQGM